MDEILDNNQKILLELLSAGIRGRPYLPENPTYYDSMDWKTLINEADKHHVLSLIYQPLYENRIELSVPEVLAGQVREYVLFTAMKQERDYAGMVGILSRFANEGIPLIVLKGIGLRKLYINPGLRVMSDYDLMIKFCDYRKADKILKEAGYVLECENDYEASYLHSILPKVDLHLHMESTGHIKEIGDFENRAWERVVPILVSDVKLLSLSPTDNAIFLILHMASHIISSGFGLKQLCDFVLLTEKYDKDIDWGEFFETAEKMGLSVFTAVVLQLSQLLFGLDIHVMPSQYVVSDMNLVKSLKDDVFSGGVYGLSNMERVTAKRLLYYSDNNISNSTWGKFISTIKLIFPKADKLGPKYSYAKKHYILLPAAWLHRLVYCFIRRDMDLKEKALVLTPQKALEIGVDRSALLKQLGLTEP